MSKKTTNAVRIQHIFGSSDGQGLVISVIDEFSKTRDFPIHPTAATRLTNQKAQVDYTHSYTLFHDEDGAVTDFIRTLRPEHAEHLGADNTGSLGSASATDRSLVVLLKDPTGKVQIKTSIGLNALVVDQIKSLVQARLNESNLNAFDILDDQFIVMDIRENGRYIYVEPTQA